MALLRVNLMHCSSLAQALMASCCCAASVAASLSVSQPTQPPWLRGSVGQGDCGWAARRAKQGVQEVPLLATEGTRSQCRQAEQEQAR